MSCGSSHTLVLSQDGRTVWSFGGGDNGNYLHYYTLKFCVYMCVMLELPAMQTVTMLEYMVCMLIAYLHVHLALYL